MNPEKPKDASELASPPEDDGIITLSNPSTNNIDTTQLFQKDSEPIVANQKRNYFARLGKKKLLILASLLFFILLGGGLGFAKFNKSDKQSDTHQTSEEKAGNAESSASNDSTIDKTAGQTVASDGSIPSSGSTSSPTAGNSTTNTSSGGSTGTSGESGGGSSGGGGTTTTSPKTYDISYTNSCYSPANATVKKGDTVKFTNNSTKGMWPASNNHPSHTIYSEFDAKGSISSGGTYSFTFTKIGSWGYHDHLKPSCSGTITVQ